MRRAALFLLLCLLVASCSSTAAGPGSLPPLSSAPSPAVPTPSAGPTGSPSPVASPAPSASPAAVVPLPPAATAFTEEGAQAFARYWYDVLNRAQESLDPSLISAISAPDCISCGRYARSLSLSKEGGEVYRGGLWTVVEAAGAPLDDRPIAQVLVTYNVTELNIVGGDGVSVKTFPSRDNDAETLDLNWSGRGWVVQEIKDV